MDDCLLGNGCERSDNSRVKILNGNAPLFFFFNLNSEPHIQSLNKQDFFFFLIKWVPRMLKKVPKGSDSTW